MNDSWGFGSAIPSGDPAPAEEPERALGLRAGTVFGDFALAEELGRGGFGVVFRARERASQRYVALKILTRPLKGTHRERFLREGEITAALHHPGIVRIHSAGEADGLPYLSYELVEGGATLRDRLAQPDLPRNLDLILQVAQALAYAHAQGVVHRDLKPDNVLIDAQGRALVADFGLARRQGAEGLTRDGAVIGTPTHMSPEGFRGEPIGAPGDVWALGVLLYQALCGELPFVASNLIELAVTVARSDPEPPSAFGPVPPALEAVARRAMVKDPAGRYPDAGAFAAALEAALAEGSPRWRLRVSRGSAGALLAASLLVGLGWAISARGTRASRRLEAALDQGVERAQLAALLSATQAQGESSLRARAHLRLAEPGGSVEERLAHAERALALGASEVEGALALALACHDAARPAEALAAFERARAAGASPAALLPLAYAEAHALAAAGQLQPALERARAHLAAGVPEPEAQRRAWALRARLEVLCRAEGAEESLNELAARRARGDAAALRADWVLARGEDPEPLLRAALDLDPRAWEVRVRLARARLGAGRPCEALALVRAAPPPAASLLPPSLDAAASARLLEGLAAHPLQLASLGAVPPAWRAAVARWCLRAGHRALGLSLRVRDPLYPVHPATPSAEVYGGRARAALRVAAELGAPSDSAQAYALLSRLGLAGALERARALDPGGPAVRAEGARVALLDEAPARALEALGPERPDEPLSWAALRGEALLAGGDAAAARAPLRRALGPREVDPRLCALLAEAEARVGGAEEGARLRALAGRLALPPSVEVLAALEAAREQRRARILGRNEIEANFARLLARDPRLHEAREALARFRFTAKSSHADLRELFWAAAHDPTIHARVWRDLLLLDRGLTSMAYIEQLRAQYPVERPEDRLYRALLGVSELEFAGERPRAHSAPELLVELEAWLADEPAELFALEAQAFLLIRSGALADAARLLRVVREAEPDCLQAAFYEFLLAAALDAPTAELSARFAQLKERHYPVWKAHNWSIRAYPEFKGLAHAPGFEILRGPRDR